MISNREGTRHGSASGVGRANGPEQAEGKRKASKARWPAGTLTGRRGRPDRAFTGRARTRVARTSDDRPGELRRRGTRGPRVPGTPYLTAWEVPHHQSSGDTISN